MGGDLHRALGHDQSRMRCIIRMPRGNESTKQTPHRTLHRGAASFRGWIFRRRRELWTRSLQVVIPYGGAILHGPEKFRALFQIPLPIFIAQDCSADPSTGHIITGEQRLRLPFARYD